MEKQNLTWNPFKDKQVALIGNASLYYTQDVIARIENHNLVIRINEGVFTNKYRHLGVKTDVGFFAHVWKWPFKDLTCEIVLVNQAKLSPGRLHKAYKQIAMQKSLDSKDYERLPIWNAWDIVKKLELNVPEEVPSSGAHILNYLSYCNCNELNIFNFDWKTTPSFYQKNINTNYHNFSKEREYFSNLITETSNWNLILP